MQLKSSSQFNLDAVDMDYTSALLMPEVFSARQPCLDPTKTAIAHRKMVFNVGSGVSGNAGVYIFPNQPLADGTADMAGSFYTILNQPDFDYMTGLGTPTFYPGPLNPLSSAIL
jgi:hypothetical protein